MELKVIDLLYLATKEASSILLKIFEKYEKL